MKNSEAKPGVRFPLEDGTVCVILAAVVPEENNPLGNKWWAAPLEDNSKPAFMVCFDVDMIEGWATTKSFAKLEFDGNGWQQLKVNYVLGTCEPIRKNILLRRAFAVLAAEENRIYALTDAEAIAELDALKASQDKQFVKKLDS